MRKLRHSKMFQVLLILVILLSMLPPNLFSFALPVSAVESVPANIKASNVPLERLLVEPAGSVPSSGRHPQWFEKTGNLNPWSYTSIKENGILHRSTVADKHMQFRKTNSSQYVTDPISIAGENEAAVRKKMQEIIDREKKKNQYATPTEALVFPVHSYRTYPVSVLDCNKFSLEDSKYGKVPTESELRNGTYFGRCNAFTYTPGNDPYMNNMSLSDWTYYSKTWGTPSGSYKKYEYYNWQGARFENRNTDYFLQMKFDVLPPRYVKIELVPSKATIKVGDTQQFKVYGYLNTGHKVDITTLTELVSSKTDIAEIDFTGLATGYEEGVTGIIATFEDPVSGKELVDRGLLTVVDDDSVIPADPGTIELTPEYSAIMVGENQSYKVEYIKADGSRLDVTSTSSYSSSNTSIASIDSTGKAIGIEEGQVTITATYDGKTDTAILDVTELIIEYENKPPIASLEVLKEYYWIETVEMTDSSYDPDGTIVSTNLLVDGKPSSLHVKYPRVTVPENHVAHLTVTDDDGASSDVSKSFEILPTTPTADLSVYGSLKVNRKIVLDATNSDSKSPVHVAPIDYSQTNWTITPITEGITQDDIKVKVSSDYSKREILVRKPGEYEATVTVTNNLGETSEPVTKKFTVAPDLKPIAQFTVEGKKVLRDETGIAKVKLTDSSYSIDDDTIAQRIWYIEYDSNNDGLFGTKRDTPKQVISDANEPVVYYETDRVGNYRFNLEVVESFNQPTIPEFILAEHYLRDDTEPTLPVPLQSIDQYHKVENFNIPQNDKAVTVDNAPPVVDFGITKHNKVDIYLNFAGLDTATMQTNHTNYGSQDRYYRTNYVETRTWEAYDYSYDIDSAEKNKLTALAGDLEVNLITKGIDARVVIDNSYENRPDPDGTYNINYPNWGTTYWTDSYYDTVTSASPNYSPPSGWYITSTTDNTQNESYTFTCSFSTGTYWCPNWDSYTSTLPSCGYLSCTSWSKTFVNHTYADRTESDARREEKGLPPLSQDAFRTSSTDRYSRVNTVSRTYNIRKDVPRSAYEIQNFTTSGSQKPFIDTTDYSEAISNASYRAGADSYYIRYDKRNWSWTNNTSKFSSVISAMKNNSIYLWNTANNDNRVNFEKVMTNGSKLGQFTVYDSTAAEKHVQEIEDYFISNYAHKEDGVNKTIVLGDKVDYTVTYEDHENDPELKREWKFEHDPTKVNGRVIDNQPSGPIAQNGLWINNPMQLPAVGTYKIQLRAMDDPIHFKDSRFYNFRKWSDESIVREYTVNVHRRPTALFNFTVDQSDNFKLTLDPSPSYDIDFKTNRDDKGIAEYEWSYYLDGVEYEGKPPANVQVDKFYDVTLTVTDIDGASDSITKRISTKNENLPPVALFEVQDIVTRSEKLNFIDLSYDPNDDPLTNYQITVRKQGDQTVLKNLTSWPESFEEMGLPIGEYVIGLTVDDIPKVGASLTSELYERNIKVIRDNDPPVSLFTLSPNPVEKGKLLTYEDQSYDPNGDPLINYSWLVEQIDENGNVIESWNTGVPPTDLEQFGGIGKYRITQTVFDDPPFPLQSLSDDYTIEVEMIQGPEAPFAEFAWEPLQPTEEDTITLDPSYSYDLDGTIEGYDWSIKAPNGIVTTSTLMNPKIMNAQVGEYEVTLNVIDNDGLKSIIPAVHTILVKPKAPNKPPVAEYIWEPFKLFLGDNVKLNPEGSYDVDGTIVSYEWSIAPTIGATSSSTEKYPEFIATSSQYEVTLKVTDNDGDTDTITKTIEVNIAKLQAFVTHTDEWRNRWAAEGFNPDINMFKAGEKFVIELTSTPAAYVWGSIDLGVDIGKVEIPSASFNLVSTSSTKYVWRAELWQDNFKYIPNGEYLFNFSSMHPVNSPYVQADANYLVMINQSIYDAFKFHRAK